MADTIYSNGNRKIDNTDIEVANVDQIQMNGTSYAIKDTISGIDSNSVTFANPTKGKEGQYISLIRNDDGSFELKSEAHTTPAYSSETKKLYTLDIVSEGDNKDHYSFTEISIKTNQELDSTPTKPLGFYLTETFNTSKIQLPNNKDQFITVSMGTTNRKVNPGFISTNSTSFNCGGDLKDTNDVNKIALSYLVTSVYAYDENEPNNGKDNLLRIQLENNQTLKVSIPEITTLSTNPVSGDTEKIAAKTITLLSYSQIKSYAYCFSDQESLTFTGSSSKGFGITAKDGNNNNVDIIPATGDNSLCDKKSIYGKHFAIQNESDEQRYLYIIVPRPDDISDLHIVAGGGADKTGALNDASTMWAGSYWMANLVKKVDTVKTYTVETPYMVFRSSNKVNPNYWYGFKS